MQPRQERHKPLLPPPPNKPLPLPQRNTAYNIQHNQYQRNRYQQPWPQKNYLPAPRPTGPKPPVPMSVGQSVQSRQVNYINPLAPNRPGKSGPYQSCNQHHPFNGHSDNHPLKQQRLFNTEPQEEEQYLDEYEQEVEEHAPNLGYDTESLGEEPTETEVNFMIGAYPAFLT